MPPLETIVHHNGIVTLRSAGLHALGVPHAFTTRIGGVSTAPFDTLNLAGIASSGGVDEEPRRHENHRRTLEALGRPDHRWTALHLVHGNDVLVCDGACPASAPTADGVATAERGRMLKVTIADCVALLLSCRASGAVAAVHAGWRGVVGGVVLNAVRTLQDRFGAAPSDLVAAIGPCIGVEAFEVGEEVAEAFHHAGLSECVARAAKWPRPHVDLFAAVSAQLRRAGVDGSAIDGSPRCTASEPDLFFSHRRDAGRTGRLAAIIACPGG